MIKFIAFAFLILSNSYAQQSFPVDNIKVGMTLADVAQIHPKASVVKVPNKYGNCADDIDFGYEIRKNNALIAFVILNKDGKIGTMIVTSPKFKFNGISTNSSVSSVLKLHPDAKLTNDSLDNWEYMHLQNPNITLGFETDENNRVAIYEDETFVKLNRKNAKVDFIKIE